MTSKISLINILKQIINKHKIYFLTLKLKLNMKKSIVTIALLITTITLTYAQLKVVAPMSESNYFQSPYVYAANNPINFLDILGLDDFYVNGNRALNSDKKSKVNNAIAAEKKLKNAATTNKIIETTSQETVENYSQKVLDDSQQ